MSRRAAFARPVVVPPRERQAIAAQRASANYLGVLKDNPGSKR